MDLHKNHILNVVLCVCAINNRFTFLLRILVKGVLIINSKIINITDLSIQKRYLANEILKGSNRDKFLVVNMEAGTGKTRTTEHIISDNFKSNDNYYLLVRPEIEDCKKSTNNINKAAGNIIATYYDSKAYQSRETKRQFLDNIKNYKVVCISHEKYKHLCRNSVERGLFCKDRNTLIIDEFINPIEKVYINDNIYQNLLNVFTRLDLIALSTLIEKLYSIIRTRDYSKQKVHFICSDTIKDIINELLRLITSSIDKGDFYRLIKSNQIVLCDDLKNIIFTDSEPSLLRFTEYIKSLKNFADNFIYYYKEYGNNTYLTYDNDFNFFMLNNNIILDAGAELQPLYSSNKYKIAEFNKVCDHSNFILCNIPIVTTKSAKKELYIKYYDDVMNYLNDNINNLDNLLIIGNKNDKDILTKNFDVNKQNIAYFGNIIGKNSWREFRNSAVIQTPIYPQQEYVLIYLYLYKNSITISELNTINTSVKTVGSGIGKRTLFINSEIEKISCMLIANEIYQAIKRINRNMKYTSNCYLFFNNDDVLRLVQKMLLNCKIEIDYNTHFKYRKTAKEQYNENRKLQKQDNKYTNFYIKFCNDVETGKYNSALCDNFVFKKDFYKLNNNPIDNRNKFRLHITNNIYMQQYNNAHDIEVTSTKIVFNNKKRTVNPIKIKQ